MQGALSTLPPGLAGYVLADDQRQRQQQSQMGILMQLAQLQGNQDDRMLRQQMQPLQMQQLQAGIEKSKADAAQTAAKNQFFSPAGQAPYMEGGRPVGSDEFGPPTPALAPQMNFPRMMQDAASRNFIPPEAYMTHRNTEALRAETAQATSAQRADTAQATAAQRAETNRRAEQERIDRNERFNAGQAQARQIADQGDLTRRAIAAGRAPPAAEPLHPVIGPDGKAVLVPRSQAVGRTPYAASEHKPMTEFQGKSSLYGTRAAQSHKILESLEENVSSAGIAVKEAVSKVPVIGGVAGVVGNAMLSTGQQKVEQAQRDFINAVLRQESGAVISDMEFENGKKQYFPQPNDDKATRDQKRANRELAIKGFARMAGSGAADIDEILGSPLMPAAGNEKRRATDGNDPLGIRR